MNDQETQYLPQYIQRPLPVIRGNAPLQQRQDFSSFGFTIILFQECRNGLHVLDARILLLTPSLS